MLGERANRGQPHPPLLRKGQPAAPRGSRLDRGEPRRRRRGSPLPERASLRRKRSLLPEHDGDAHGERPFSVSPFAAGTYIVEAFYDYTGEFLPTFKFRELPEQGDVAGGYIDTIDAIHHADAGVDYKPIFLPITVGVPAGTTDAGPDAATGAGLDGGQLVLPASGYVANNITVSVGSVLPIPRPYFYPSGATAPASRSMATPANPSGNPSYVPAQTMAQDIQILAQPQNETYFLTTVPKFQASLTAMTFLAGVPTNEVAAATSPTDPFQFQLTAADDATSLFTWTDGTSIPESSLLSNLLPQVVFTKLIDDPDHTLDPQSILQQVPPTGPIVVVLGLTLPPRGQHPRSRRLSGEGPGPDGRHRPHHGPHPPGRDLRRSHAARARSDADRTAPDRDEPRPGRGGPPGAVRCRTVIAALTPIFGKINGPVQGCLPPGRYAPNFVYPTGQAWTVPNESGSCAVAEGVVAAGEELLDRQHLLARRRGRARRPLLAGDAQRARDHRAARLRDVCDVPGAEGVSACGQSVTRAACP